KSLTKSIIKGNIDGNVRKKKYMMNNNQKLNIQFDFKKDGSNKGPLLFSNPIKIISTSNPHEIQHCLNQIDKAVEEGYYAAGYMSYEAINACNIQIKSIRCPCSFLASIINLE